MTAAERREVMLAAMVKEWDRIHERGFKSSPKGHCARLLDVALAAEKNLEGKKS